MANKKLSQFNPLTNLIANLKFALFVGNSDNYHATYDVVGKWVSIFQSVTTSITAYAGGGQANATSLTNKFNFVTTCATRGDSVKVPAALQGMHMFVINQGAQMCSIYPQTGENFNGKAANAAISLPVNTYMEVFCETDGVWQYRPIVSVYTVSAGVTAYAGGGQANATQLNNEINEVSVVATNADSVKLRAATKGLRQVVDNTDSTQYCNVYPQTGDNFNGLAANAAVSLYAGSRYEFICYTDGTWSII